MQAVGCPRVSRGTLRSKRSEEQAIGQADDQQREHDKEHGADDLCAVFQGETGTDIVSRNAAQGCRDPHRPHHLSRQSKGDQRGHVAGGIGYLRISGSREQVESADAGES